jgi:hypothetical protein
MSDSNFNFKEEKLYYIEDGYIKTRENSLNKHFTTGTTFLVLESKEEIANYIFKALFKQGIALVEIEKIHNIYKEII